jgi:centrosomal protein CEP290
MYIIFFMMFANLSCCEQEIESNEKLRMEIRNLELQKEQLNSQLQDSKSMSGLDRERPGTAGAMDSKGWKSAVVTRMYEGKLKDLEKELDKKVSHA